MGKNIVSLGIGFVVGVLVHRESRDKVDALIDCAVNRVKGIKEKIMPAPDAKEGSL